MGGLDDLAEKTASLLDDIKTRTARGRKTMEDAKAREAQRNADAMAVKKGMAVTFGPMDRTPTPGSPGVSMGSREMSHPADGEKVSIE